MEVLHALRVIASVDHGLRRLVTAELAPISKAARRVQHMQILQPTHRQGTVIGLP